MGIREVGSRKEEGLRIRLLGAFTVQCNGIVIPDSAWGRPKAKAVLKVLGITPDHSIHRDRLVDLLWPELDVEDAQGRLRRMIHLARKALEPQGHAVQAALHLQADREMVGLNLDRTWVDVDEFEDAAERALESDEAERADQALAIYRGDLLPEDLYEDWTAERRRSLTELHLRLLLHAASLCEGQGDVDRSLAHLHRALDHDPLLEDVHRRIMGLQASSGRRHQAVRQYHTLRRVLQAELEVPPAPETEQLYQTIAAGLPPVGEPSPTRQLPLPPGLQDTQSRAIVGRERPLELLQADIRAVTEPDATDRVGMVAIGGEAGVGKTRLAIEIASLARHSGMGVLWGSSFQQEGQHPYAPLVEALEGHLAACPQTEREHVATSYPELGLVLPSIASLGHRLGVASIPPESNRNRLYAATGGWLSEIAARTPLLIVLDDVHLAGSAALELMQYLSRVGAREPWLILATYREEDAPAASHLARMTGLLARTGLCRRLELLPLGREDSAILVVSQLEGQASKPDALDGPPDSLRVDPLLLEQLYSLSLGNPLYLGELVSSMRESGAIVATERGWSFSAIGRERTGLEARLESGLATAVLESPLDIPVSLREMVEVRVKSLGSDVYRLLALAAVAGTEFTFSTIRTASMRYHHVSESSLLDLLDQALEPGIIEDRGDRYAFRHPLFREALYSRLASARRTALHGLLGQIAEERRPDDVEVLAYHYGRSEDVAKALVYHERAGDRAHDLFANDNAAMHYRRAIDLIEDERRHVDAARLRSRLAWVLANAGEYEASLEVAELAADPLEAAGDLEGIAQTSACAGEIMAMKGDPAAGETRVKRAITLLESHGGRTRGLAVLYSALIRIFHPQRRGQEILEAAGECLSIAREIGDKNLEARAVHGRGLAFGALGRVRDALHATEECVRVSAEGGFLRVQAMNESNTGALLAVLGRVGDSKEHRVRAIATAERCGDPSVVAFCEGGYAGNLVQLGKWTEARAHARRSLEILTRFPNPWFESQPKLWLGILDVFEGNWNEGYQMLEDLTGRARELGDGINFVWSQVILSDVERRTGRVAEARARLEDLLVSDLAQSARLGPLVRSRLAPVYVLAGESREAIGVIQQAETEARAWEVYLVLADVVHAKAIVLTAENRWADAVDAFEEAIQRYRDMPQPYLEARAHLSYGLALAERGHLLDARRQVENALAAFRRLGAARDVQEACDALATL